MVRAGERVRFRAFPALLLAVLLVSGCAWTCVYYDAYTEGSNDRPWTLGADIVRYSHEGAKWDPYLHWPPRDTDRYRLLIKPTARDPHSWERGSLVLEDIHLSAAGDSMPLAVAEIRPAPQKDGQPPRVSAFVSGWFALPTPPPDRLEFTAVLKLLDPRKEVALEVWPIRGEGRLKTHHGKTGFKEFIEGN